MTASAGRPAPRTPPVGWILGSLVVLAMVGLACFLFQRHSGPVRFGPRGYAVLSDTSVRIEWDVSMAPGTTALCLVRSRDLTGLETGSSIVRVGPSPRGTIRASYVLTTAARANTGEVIDCQAAKPGQDEGAPVASG